LEKTEDELSTSEKEYLNQYGINMGRFDKRTKLAIISGYGTTKGFNTKYHNLRKVRSGLLINFTVGQKFIA
jgi:hypothetical protein